MEIFLGRLMRLWSHWELRVLVLMSFSLQIFLTLFANHRKRSAAQWAVFIVWLVYLLADAVATTALGVLARSDSGDHEHPSPNLNTQLFAFWSPFLLLHLGGPDVITAFSLEDSQLWLRHLFTLIFQLGLCAYVFFKSLVPGYQLWLLSIPMFLAGIIKYGERTWALMSASREHFRDSVLPPPNPGPDYPQLMEIYASKKAQGLGKEDILKSLMTERLSEPDFSSLNVGNKSEAHVISLSHDARRLFQTFRRLFLDAALTYQEAHDSLSFFSEISWEDAFKVIEMELQCMYDLLYTKVVVIHTHIGSILRFISFSSILSVLIIFVFMIDKRGYLDIDIAITYILLGGAAFLEICQVILLLSSKPAMIWLHEHRSHRLWALIFKVILFLQVKVGLQEPALSNSMTRFNLLSFCLQDKPTWFRGILHFFRVKEMLDKYRCTTYEVVSDDLKSLIFLQLKRKSDEMLNIVSPIKWKKLCRTRGKWMLRKMKCHEELDWSVETEFDKSIILWHIATDLCYYSDSNNQVMISDTTLQSKYEASKVLSDYLLYLLDMRPFMLPAAGIGAIRFQDTCAETKRFLLKEECILNEAQACTRLLGVKTEVEPTAVKGFDSKSVLFDACILAKLLQELKLVEERWEMIRGVWLEMLIYAAIECKGLYHAQQLNIGGGELLTRVWLLMSHFCLSDHFQMTSEPYTGTVGILERVRSRKKTLVTGQESNDSLSSSESSSKSPSE